MAMARKGRGVRTVQYNPGAVSAEQWALAVLSMKGESDAMPVDAAVEMIRKTPAKRRSEFAREIVRHKHLGRRASSDLVRMLTRSNPSAAAIAAAESFHGPDPQGVSETVIVEDLHEHTNLTGLGLLTQIKLKGGVKISKFQGAILCSNEAGTQLFVRGGDQQVSLIDFDVDATKEKVNLGRVTHLDYETRKFHLETADKKLGIYRHRLGEVTGVLPDLVYDTVNKLLEFVGGAYYIKWDDYDGAHSGGIAD
jgi:hypothetical protein